MCPWSYWMMAKLGQWGGDSGAPKGNWLAQFGGEDLSLSCQSGFRDWIKGAVRSQRAVTTC
jgi:hypothetical protein